MNDSKKGAICQTPNVFCVYVIWCSLTDKFYVGVTHQKVKRRIKQHRHGKQFIDNEIKRIGWEGNFDWWVVKENISTDIITEREQHWVAFFNSVYPNGYNKTIGGIKYFKHSKKTREKMSKSHIGKTPPPFSAEHRANLSKAMSGENHPMYGKPAWNRGIPCSEESKSKISKTLTGRKRPDQSERMKGENHPMYGKHLSDETKAKMSESKRGKTPWNKGIPRSEETKAKISKARSGQPCPEETKAKLRGRHPSEEARTKMSEAQKGEKNHFYGKHHTAETKEKISRANSGRHPSEETLAKMRGRHPSEEARAKMSEAHKGEKNHFYGKHHTEESKEKNRQAHLGKSSWNKGVPCRPETRAKLRTAALARNAAKKAAQTTP